MLGTEGGEEEEVKVGVERTDEELRALRRAERKEELRLRLRRRMLREVLQEHRAGVRAAWWCHDECRMMFTHDRFRWAQADTDFRQALAALERQQRIYQETLREEQQHQQDEDSSHPLPPIPKQTCPSAPSLPSSNNPWTASLYIPRLRDPPKPDHRLVMHRLFVDQVDRLPVDALLEEVCKGLAVHGQEMGLDTFLAAADLSRLLSESHYAETDPVPKLLRSQDPPDPAFVSIRHLRDTTRAYLTSPDTRYPTLFGCFSRIVSSEAHFKWRVAASRQKKKKLRRRGVLKGPDTATVKDLEKVACGEYMGEAPHPNRARLGSFLMSLDPVHALPYTGSPGKLSVVDFVAALGGSNVLFSAFFGAVLDIN